MLMLAFKMMCIPPCEMKPLAKTFHSMAESISVRRKEDRVTGEGVLVLCCCSGARGLGEETKLFRTVATVREPLF